MTDCVEVLWDRGREQQGGRRTWRSSFRLSAQADMAPVERGGCWGSHSAARARPTDSCMPPLTRFTRCLHSHGPPQRALQHHLMQHQNIEQYVMYC